MENQVEVEKKECMSCGEEMKEQQQSYALECERCMNQADEWLA
ncbi:MAG: protein YhfH [Tumebacillaceae bacterium]